MNETNQVMPEQVVSPKGAEDQPFIEEEGPKRMRPPRIFHPKYMSKSHSNIIEKSNTNTEGEGISPYTPKSSIFDKMFGKTKTSLPKEKEKDKDRDKDSKGDSSRNQSESEAEVKRRFSIFNFKQKTEDKMSKSDKDNSKNASMNNSNRTSIFKRDKGSEDGNGQSMSEEERGSPKKGMRNNNFTLEHLKLLKQQIENEKKILEDDINQVLESEKKKKQDPDKPLETGHKMWSKKIKNNLMAFTRVKMLNDDLRLWGSSMNIVGLNPKDYEHVKRLMAEHQVENQRVIKKKKRYLIYPDDLFAHVWNLIYFIILIYTAFSTPYRVAFIDDLPFGLIVIENLTDCLFGIDMVLTVFTAIMLDNGQYIEDIPKLFIRYLTTWMIPDFIGIFPMQLFVQSNNSANDFFKFLRLPRLSRLLRLVKLVKTKKIKNNRLIDQIRDSLRFSAATVRIFNFLFLVIISLNFVGCMWYFVAKQEELGPDTWVYQAGLAYEDNITIYIASIYWAVTTLATVGFGDITAYSDYERMFAVAWMVVGVGIYSFTIGSLTSILGNQDTREGYLSAKLLLMDEFGKDTKLPKELRLKIKRTLEYNSIKNVFNQHERDEFFRDIPIDLKYEIAEIMHRGVIHKLTFFKNKDNVFIANIVPLLEPLKVSKGEIIYRTGEYPISIYFLISGRVNIVVGANMLNLKTYVQGCYFGEIEILNNTTRQSTIRAEYDCDLLTLNRKAFLRLMEDFPNYREELRTIAEERQMRIGEALRKIKRILPISANSNFWNKKRETSLYDIPLKEQQQLAQQSDDQERQAGDSASESVSPNTTITYNPVVKSRFAVLKREDNIGIPEAEKENEMDSKDYTRQEDLKLEEDTDSKLTNLIDPKDIDEEERKLSQFIEKAKKKRKEAFNLHDEKPFTPSLTTNQIKQKIDIAEGTGSRPKSIFIVSRNKTIGDENTSNPALSMDEKKASDISTTVQKKKPQSASNRKNNNTEKVSTPKKIKSDRNSGAEDVYKKKLRKSLSISALKKNVGAGGEEDPYLSSSAKGTKRSFLQKFFNRKNNDSSAQSNDEKVGPDDNPLVLPDSDDQLPKERIDVIEIPVEMITNIKDHLNPEDFQNEEKKYATVESSPDLQAIKEIAKTVDALNQENKLEVPSKSELINTAPSTNLPTLNLNLIKDGTDVSDGGKSEKRGNYKILIHQASANKKEAANQDKDDKKSISSIQAHFTKGVESNEGSRKLTLDIPDKKNDSKVNSGRKKTSFQEDNLSTLKGSRRDSVSSVSSMDSEVEKDKDGNEIIKEFKEKGWYNQLTQIGRPSRKKKSHHEKSEANKSSNPEAEQTVQGSSYRNSQFKNSDYDANTPKKTILKMKRVENTNDDNKLVHKYKSKVKKLVETIKIMKKEFKKMQTEVNLVREKLDGFDVIVDAITTTLDKLNAQAAEKVEKDRKKQLFTPLAIPPKLQITNLDMPTSTRYNGENKTIVFHFQKPIPSKVRSDQNILIEDNFDDVSTFMQSPTNAHANPNDKGTSPKRTLVDSKIILHHESSNENINFTKSSISSKAPIESNEGDSKKNENANFNIE